MTKQSVPFGRKSSYALVACILSCVLISGSSMAFTVYVFRQFCSLLITMDEAYTDTPPTTPTGISMARDIKHLRNTIFCQ